ncbi:MULTISPECIES: VOC family protein [Streptomyces]|uniref:VOC family protein n=1 Tax=Streptomyces koelreuteriae TaxID=2838015 RepID=A0ABX8G3K4_9ACTN|nr:MULTISPECIES: VOC family protein [Streptomyces]QWB27802.1 VOC family protein [Streptomyces koelreuteriae]UUA10907.1 VOC family protein [Streptomyces koelreuteriae]UUA18513.1 VOC family protein [Streptomyces sp. CRCS-T-1]
MTITPGASVFGAVHLGYIVIETDRFTDWRRFGTDAIGMHHDDLETDVMRFRLDDQECRFLLRRGPAEDVVATGWHIDDHTTFERIEHRVRAHGVPVVQGTEEEAELRGVERLLRFPGPKGITQEIYTTPVTSPEPLRMLASGWVTGEAGMGHVAITSAKPALMRGYFTTVFDARLTDYIDETISGVKLKIRFLRVNERHHSLAIAAVRGLPIDPIRTRVQHLNIQAASLDDLARSYERVHELGFDMALSVGQHTNDKELSYYARTPSGFEWEVGWNPIVIDESTWEPGTHQGISVWGHLPVGQTIVDKLDQFRLGARSLAHPEKTVRALSGAGVPDD